MESKKSKSSGNSPLFRWHEEMLRHLLLFLKTFAATQKISLSNIDQLIQAIYIDQTRAPWPGSFLSPEKKELWKQFVERNSKILIYTNGEAAYSEFASKISSRLLRELSAAQITSTLLSQEAVRHTQIEHMIRQEFYSRGSPADTVSRSVQRYFRAEAKTRRDRTEIKMSEDDPMRDLLSLPRIGRSLLPREDLRVHLARYLSSPSIGKHLQRASSFAALSGANQMFSDELSKLCKPVGFADRHYRILLVEASSASAAQDMAFNKASLIARIRKIPGFEKIQDIKFRLAQDSTSKSS